jgi:hypothetical protein
MDLEFGGLDWALHNLYLELGHCLGAAFGKMRGRTFCFLVLHPLHAPLIRDGILEFVGGKVGMHAYSGCLACAQLKFAVCSARKNPISGVQVSKRWMAIQNGIVGQVINRLDVATSVIRRLLKRCGG